MLSAEHSIILGQNIRDIRKSLHLTQEQFAEKLDINPQVMSHIETGNTGISIENAVNICNIANCPAIHLFKGIIKSPNIIEKYELLTDRDKSVVNQIISSLLNTE